MEEVTINLKLPAWANKRKLWILAGQELIAYRGTQTKTWYVKTERCSNCGECCRDLTAGWRYGVVGKRNTCSRLIEDGPGRWICDNKKGPIPFDCLKGNGHDTNPNCTEKFEEVT